MTARAGSRVASTNPTSPMSKRDITPQQPQQHHPTPTAQAPNLRLTSALERESAGVIRCGRSESGNLQELVPLASFDWVDLADIDVRAIFPDRPGLLPAACIHVVRAHCVAYLQREHAPYAAGTAALLELVDAAAPLGATHLFVEQPEPSC